MSEVSIVIPVYNVESWLRQCLDSVLTQTFTDFELILANDGSSDTSGTIYDEYAARDSRIRVIHQENTGQGKARNVGMDQADGKYLIFLDSDDYWLPSTLAALYRKAERNQTQVLMFGAIPFWDGMEEPGRHPGYQHTVQNGIVKSGPKSLKVSLDAGEYYPSPCLRFYRLNYIRETGLRFDEGIIHEDITFSFFAVLLADRVECIGERFYQRRYRPGSTMTGKSICDSAHGYRVALDGLLNANDNCTFSALGREQLERYIVINVRMIWKLYGDAISLKQNAWQAARWIRKDTRQSLKRA